jgi:hypothetical protein
MRKYLRSVLCWYRGGCDRIWHASDGYLTCYRCINCKRCSVQ